ncbi:uncharacterized protein si:ch211-1a19.3 [Dunckerocampus dactyliophorus]|uniref:uncharacterized protein si:ch211-1a19.3 n=1 Tax=Dunckerocampus dactyliophorus TaxID=161453 RepID=UPI002406CDDC|nr:uncharacterized protein si:ch211-1a19.3 [Dunckerocampus dactyliophorus]
MATSSKSSGSGTKVALALLALWSIISLVVIVVWSTSPDLKSSARCRQELQENTEKLEGAKVVWSKNKEALEEQLEEARRQRERQEVRMAALLQRLHAANATLEACHDHKAVMQANISTLQEEAEHLWRAQVNLTAQLRHQEDQVEVLQHNLTQADHRMEACVSLKAAADNHATAAQTQTRACEANQKFLHKQLLKCKEPDSEAPPPPQTQNDPAGSTATPLAAMSAVTLLASCVSLLMT